MRFAVLIIAIVSVLLSCMPEEPEDDYTNLPYPPTDRLEYYQAQVDSGYEYIWSDIRMVASAYMQNSKYYKYDVKTSDFIIRGEGIFIATIEVETQDFILELRFDRPFKVRGRKSIWQIVSAKEMPWPKKRSKSEE